MTDMPTTYETHQAHQTTTTTSGTHPPIAPRIEYIQSVPGILKIVEIVLNLITFICACIVWWGAAGGWVRFVAISAFVTTLVYFILHFINAAPRLNYNGLFTLILLGLLTFSCTYGGYWGQAAAYVGTIAGSAMLSAVMWFVWHLFGFHLQRFTWIHLWVLCLVVFICSVIVFWRGEGWVGFVAMSAFLTTLIWFLLTFLGVIERIPYQMRIVILDLFVIICACIGYWEGAQSFAEFVCITAFITTILFLTLHVLGLISRFPGPSVLIEFIYYCIFSVFYLIAAIVAAAYATAHSSIAACTFFAFAATAVYAVDTFFQFRAWRAGQTEMATSNITTTTTTRTTVVESAATY